MRYDLHIHSKYSSDGYLDPKMIVKIANKRGLSGVALTDHNTLKGGLKTKEYETDDFKVIVGSEINTDRGEVIGLFLSEEIKSNIFPDVTEEIKDQNGMVIIPHPFDELRGNGIRPKKEDKKFLDGVEIFNSRCILERYNYKAHEYAMENDLKYTAGSDAHFAGEIGKAGILTDFEINDVDDLRKSLIGNKSVIFGGKSSFINLGLTKVLKIWRKASSG